MKNIKIYTSNNKHVNVVWAVLGAFLVLTVFLTIQSTTVGSKLSKLEVEERDLIEQNQDLSRELVSTMSLTKIREKSEELGYSAPSDTLYLGGGDSATALK